MPTLISPTGSSKQKNSMFRALRHRNYRFFFFGQGFSLIGTWMQQIAVGWMVYRMTHSAFLLGLIGFVAQLPTFFISPIAGVLADRYDRRRMLLATQTFFMLQALILTYLVWTHHVQIWHIVVLSAFAGVLNAFDIPIRQAFTIEMIDKKEDLGNAIALNSSMLNATRLIGPSVAGLLIASFGEGICFLLNTLSYVTILSALALMKLPRFVARESSRHLLVEMKEGFRYAYHFVPIKWILLLLGVVSLMAMPYQVLMPVFARDVFHGGPELLGFLMGMAGFGAMFGALYLAARKSVVGLGRMTALAAILFGVSMIVFSTSRFFWISMGILFVSGFGIMVHMAACNTILQTIAEENKRGRVMSFYTMAFMGMMPFGSLMAGSLATRIGAPYTVLFGGICCILAALVFMKKLPQIRAQIRPIYIQKGIIPEVAQGIQTATDFGSPAKD